MSDYYKYPPKKKKDTCEYDGCYYPKKHKECDYEDYECCCYPVKKYYYDYEYECYPKEKPQEKGCHFGDICQSNKAKVSQYAYIEQTVDQTNVFVAICEEGKKRYPGYPPAAAAK